MLYATLFSGVVIILCLMPEQSQISGFFQYQFSYILIPCPSSENMIYTTDGTSCNVFRNYCHMRRANDKRRHAKKPLLSITTKADCQFQCARDCGIGGTPVCGEYAGSYIYYADVCELWKTACVEGQSIIKVPNSECTLRG